MGLFDRLLGKKPVATATERNTTIPSDLELRLRSLVAGSTTSLDSALKESIHLSGSHWIRRAKRGEGTGSQVSAHFQQITALYQNRYTLENIRCDDLGPLTSHGLGNLLFFIILTTTAVPYLIVRVGEDQYATFYFEGT